MSSQKKTKRSSGSVISSMTGYGKAVEKGPYGKFIVEIRTLNHKGLSIYCNTFNGLLQLEQRLEKLLTAKIHRGKVLVNVFHEPVKGRRGLQGVAVDRQLAEEYARQLKALKGSLGVGGEVEIGHVVALPGVVKSVISAPEQQVWVSVSKAARRALERLIAYRRKEGRHIAAEFRSRITAITKMVDRVEKEHARSVKSYRQRLLRTVNGLEGEAELSRERCDAEVASFARNCDISEEINRLKGHIAEFSSTLRRRRGDKGKKLDFIAQEMQREVNTIGAKSDDLRIAKVVIEVKTNIEKFREQIRNIE